MSTEEQGYDREALRERMDKGLAELLTLIDRLSPQEMLGLPYERFVRPFGGNWGYPMAAYVLGNTEGQYEEHGNYIRAIVEGAAS